ncbi:hypothetical protein WJX73_004664 [Symbiochloris irregularis]|uniref:PARP catalytic domain-containing protein n=1 Tax=Symbiochloris irregularis TaxID=706552 RepID=A0AAW1PRH5_9CHLO
MSEAPQVRPPGGSAAAGAVALCTAAASVSCDGSSHSSQWGWGHPKVYASSSLASTTSSTTLDNRLSIFRVTERQKQGLKRVKSTEELTHVGHLKKQALCLAPLDKQHFLAAAEESQIMAWLINQLRHKQYQTTHKFTSGVSDLAVSGLTASQAFTDPKMAGHLAARCAEPLREGTEGDLETTTKLLKARMEVLASCMAELSVAAEEHAGEHAFRSVGSVAPIANHDDTLRRAERTVVLYDNLQFQIRMPAVARLYEAHQKAEQAKALFTDTYNQMIFLTTSMELFHRTDPLVNFQSDWEEGAPMTYKGMQFRMPSHYVHVDGLAFRVVEKRCGPQGEWQSWVYIGSSATKEAGLGAYAARGFEKSNMLGYYLGRLLTKAEADASSSKYIACQRLQHSNKKVYVDALMPPQPKAEQLQIFGEIHFDDELLSWPGMCAHMANYSVPSSTSANAKVWDDGTMTAIKRIPPLTSRDKLHQSEILWDYRAYEHN